MKTKDFAVCLLIIALTIFSSCSDWLDQKPISNMEAGQIPDSEAGADMWAMGVYNGLVRMFVYDEFPRCIEFDHDYITGPTWAFGEVGSGNFQGVEKEADAAWKLNYEVVNRANEAIYHIEQMQNVGEAYKNHVIGEMYFLKAHAYFMLVRLYGEIPIFKTSINQNEKIHAPRESISAVYQHIIELLNQSKNMMFTNTENFFSESSGISGRVCAGAAAALLAKVYLTIASSANGESRVNVKGGPAVDEDGNLLIPKNLVIYMKQVKGYESFDSKAYFEKARDLADTLINTTIYGEHGLLPYSDLWSLGSKRNTKEHLFGVHFLSGDENLGSLFPSRFNGQVVNGFINTSGGGLWYGMRNHWYKLFDESSDPYAEDDLRIEEGVIHRWVKLSNNIDYGTGSFYPNTNKWWIRARGYYINGKDTVNTYVNEHGETVKYEKTSLFNDGRTYSSGKGENYLAYINKFRNVSDPSVLRTDGMYPFLRFADVYLIYAEAANELQSRDPKAIEAYNTVRRRSKAPERTTFNTQVDLRSAIIEERAKEFALEGGDRRFDLLRLGIYLDVMNAIGGVDEVNNPKYREEKHLLFPIPQDEMFANTAITENNKGWN